ncbi:MAG: hypothetical protein J2P17_09805 [Mycobacterium sp.]|nr:hypothetical protein [Mycobacterium sp.]
MQNSPGLPLIALVVAVILATITAASALAGIGADPALTELQLGATAWALALAIYGVQGVASIITEGRTLVPRTVAGHMGVRMTVVIAGLSVVLFAVSALTGLAIVSGQSTAVIGSAAGAGCLLLGLLVLSYKEAFIGHEAHLESRHDGIPW